VESEATGCHPEEARRSARRGDQPVALALHLDRPQVTRDRRCGECGHALGGVHRPRLVRSWRRADLHHTTIAAHQRRSPCLRDMTCSDGLFQFPNQSAGGTNQRSSPRWPSHRPEGAIAFWGRPIRCWSSRASMTEPHEAPLRRQRGDAARRPGGEARRGSRRARDRGRAEGAHALRDSGMPSRTHTPVALTGPTS